MREATAAGRRPLLIGVIHLRPLPGAPAWKTPLETILNGAVDEARRLLAAGCDGLIVENFGDRPFHPDRVPPVTVACMTRAVQAVRELGRFVLGVNVLRNDATASLSVAAAAGADFIRVNVHTGVYATDQGILEGRAHETLRLRRELGSRVEIWADVLCKHAQPLSHLSLAEAARDVVERGRADRIILTGRRTGDPVPPEDLHMLLDAGLGRGIFIGSGLTPQNVHEYPGAAGAIVSSALRRGGRAGAPLEEARTRALISAWKSATGAARQPSPPHGRASRRSQRSRRDSNRGPRHA